MYEIYTDGSCVGNPVAGGWGVIGKGITIFSHREMVIRNSFRPVMIRQKCLKMITDLQSMFINSKNLLGRHPCADRSA
jgi:hypothetical protein